MITAALPGVAWSQAKDTPDASPQRGMQIGPRPADGRPAANAIMQRRIDLNNASEEQLEALGLDASTARSIIGARPYRSVSELSRAGVPSDVVERLSSDVEVRPIVAPAAR